MINVKDRFAEFRLAQIATKHSVAGWQKSAFFNPLKDVAHHFDRNGGASPFAVAGMIGELHRVHRPHFDANPLKREDGGAIAYVPISDAGLNGENVHDRDLQ
jgi:hypothetical protein